MIEIYTKSNCSYCVHAKDFMKKNNIMFEEFKLDEHFNRDELKMKYPYATTYPVIVIDGNYIGGFSDLKNLYENKSV